MKVSKELLCGDVPKPIQKSAESTVTILWNQQVQTDRINPSNRLGRRNPLRKNKTRMLKDVAISGERKSGQEGSRKFLKYDGECGM